MHGYGSCTGLVFFHALTCSCTRNMCVPAVTAQLLQYGETNSFCKLLTTFSWILIRGFANLKASFSNLTVKAVAVFSQLFVASFVRTKFLLYTKALAIC